MADELWNFRADLLKKSPKILLDNLFIDDKQNYQKAESVLSNEIKVLDSALTLIVIGNCNMIKGDGIVVGRTFL